MNYFINLSNHPSDRWGEDQLQAAQKYGKIIDIPFPNIEVEITDDEMNRLVQEYAESVLGYGRPAVMVQGEFVFTYRMVRLLKERGCLVLAGRSKRIVRESRNADGQIEKTSTFVFAGFAEY